MAQRLVLAARAREVAMRQQDVLGFLLGTPLLFFLFLFLGRYSKYCYFASRPRRVDSAIEQLSKIMP